MITPIIFYNLVTQICQAFQEFNGPYIITNGCLLYTSSQLVEGLDIAHIVLRKQAVAALHLLHRTAQCTSCLLYTSRCV